MVSLPKRGHTVIHTHRILQDVSLALLRSENHILLMPKSKCFNIFIGHSFILQKVQNDLKQFTLLSSYQTGRKAEVPKRLQAVRGHIFSAVEV